MRTNKHNTKINTNYGEVSVEFDGIWAIDQDGWYLSGVDVIDFDYDNYDMNYELVYNYVIDYATYNCDPFGGDSDEETDYAD